MRLHVWLKHQSSSFDGQFLPGMTTLVLGQFFTIDTYLHSSTHTKHRSPAPALLVHAGGLDEILALLLDLQ